MFCSAVSLGQVYKLILLLATAAPTVITFCSTFYTPYKNPDLSGTWWLSEKCRAVVGHSGIWVFWDLLRAFEATGEEEEEEEKDGGRFTVPLPALALRSTGDGQFQPDRASGRGLKSASLCNVISHLMILQWYAAARLLTHHIIISVTHYFQKLTIAFQLIKRLPLLVSSHCRVFII